MIIISFYSNQIQHLDVNCIHSDNSVNPNLVNFKLCLNLRLLYEILSNHITDARYISGMISSE